MLPPVPAPEKIICVGINYPERSAEYKDGREPPKYPNLFCRFPTSLVGHDVPIVRPKVSDKFDYDPNDPVSTWGSAYQMLDLGGPRDRRGSRGSR